MQRAEQRKIAPSKVQHITIPEDAFPFVAEEGGLVFLTKAGALRMARKGICFSPAGGWKDPRSGLFAAARSLSPARPVLIGLGVKSMRRLDLIGDGMTWRNPIVAARAVEAQTLVKRRENWNSAVRGAVGLGDQMVEDGSPESGFG